MTGIGGSRLNRTLRGKVFGPAAAVLLLVLAAGSWAEAGDRTAAAERLKAATRSVRAVLPLAPGVNHLHWHIVERPPLQPGPWNINALSVDLSQPGIEVRVVPAIGGLETTSGIARRVGAIAAVNGGYFNSEGPLGLVVANGKVLSPTVSWKPPRAALGLNGDKAWLDIVDQKGDELIPLHPTQRFDWKQAEYVLGGGPRIILQGRVDINAEEEGFDENSGIELNGVDPWTAVGVRRNQLFLVTVDGRQPGLSAGWKIEQMAGFLIRECGAQTAMVLDGGGSTTMVVDGQVVNFPSDHDARGRPGVERPVANAICIFSNEVKQ